MAEAREVSRWRFLATPRWVAWHLLMVASVVGMLALGDWQLHRAESGNSLSWAYTFEWPIFAVMAVLFWLKTIRDEVHPPARSRAAAPQAGLPAPAAGGPGGADGGPGTPGEPGEPGEADEELAAYNAYLARLTREVKGHGRWHGLR